MIKKSLYLEPAPAKINLFLEVKDKRNDGFHNLETLFQAIDLMDYLTFEITVETGAGENVDFEISLDSNKDEVRNLGERNIVVNAIEVFFAHLPEEIVQAISKVSIYIFIDKNIPLEAGLAGGSANAAATLRALNNFFTENFNFTFPYNGNSAFEEDSKTLEDMAIKIGSDVPFCLIANKESRIYAESRGEKFVNIENSENNHLKDFDYDEYSQIIIVKPNFGVSTKEAFNSLDQINSGSSSCQSNTDQLKPFFYNSFEDVVLDQYPELKNIKEDLINFGCDHSLLSGAGSTIIGFASSEKNIEDILLKMKNKYRTCELITSSKFL